MAGDEQEPGMHGYSPQKENYAKRLRRMERPVS